MGFKQLSPTTKSAAYLEWMHISSSHHIMTDHKP